MVALSSWIQRNLTEMWQLSQRAKGKKNMTVTDDFLEKECSRELE